MHLGSNVLCSIASMTLMQSFTLEQVTCDYRSMHCYTDEVLKDIGPLKHKGLSIVQVGLSIRLGSNSILITMIQQTMPWHFTYSDTSIERFYLGIFNKTLKEKTRFNQKKSY